MLQGVTIPKRSAVDLCIGSANRDQNRWECAEEFDIFRKPTPHITFAAGEHTCLGLHLARMETRVAVECLLNRLTDIKLVTDDDPHIYGQPFRSPTALPVTFAPLSQTGAISMSKTTNDVAIIGVGLHPFGRFEGKSAMQMAGDAIQLALSDAGISWKDVQFAVGGSWTVANPDAIVGMVGLTGIPFTDVFNACATAASATKLCADSIRLGDYDIGIAVGMDKHPRGAFTEDPALVGMPSWYAQNGQYLTTQFFGMKANRYLHDHGISTATLAKVAAKNFRNGALNPNAFRRKPISEEAILASPVLNYPLTQYMFCAPDEGAAAVVMCRAEIAHRFTNKPVYVRAVEVRTRRYGAYEVNTTYAPVEEDLSPTVYAARAAFEKSGVAPQDVDVIQLAGHRRRRGDHSHGRSGLLR